MDSTDKIKEALRTTYTEITEQHRSGGDCSSEVACISGDYAQIGGYVAEADLGLGCGVPTEVAQIKPGDAVLDLGSGAGNDVFVARSAVGEEGKVIGVDMTEAMVEKARSNAAKLGFTNVEFRLGEVEALPVEAGSVDVVISNCVLVHVPDKRRAFSEIFRVLKPGGRFSISDIVVDGELPSEVRKLAAGDMDCASGAAQKGEYLRLIKGSGFINIRVASQKPISFSDVVQEYITEQQGAPQASSNHLLSITVYGEKPLAESRAQAGV